MSRKSRTRSLSGIYHIVVRGINKQIIFDSQYDYIHFIGILKKCMEISNFKIHAFCLMSNHIHLLIEEGDEDISLVMQRILARYSIWYNKKYERIGPLFQGRFISENVEDEEYFLTVARYIFNNPVKAGITDDVAKYRWSNYNSFWHSYDEITYTETLKQYFPDNFSFDDFMKSKNDDHCLEWERVGTVDNYDNELVNKANNLLIGIEVTKIATLNKEERDKHIKTLKNAGIRTSQISRMTGLSKSIIHKA